VYINIAEYFFGVIQLLSQSCVAVVILHSKSINCWSEYVKLWSSVVQLWQETSELFSWHCEKAYAQCTV